ncbi:MAG: patatin-like phospholipase family protein, partial [Actinomycetota bacterium]|nr:patatin-like phospholipase family protein [Actinomycetota bacterium]
MAGGGVKVAFEAGVLQVWLDEAGLTFDHADGASGGVFNLAMYCQGMSGTQMADNWRRFRPLASLSVNWSEIVKLIFAQSVLTYDGFRTKVLRSLWGIDWDAIRSTAKVATFNLYNFSTQETVVLTADQMDEDRLVSAVSLPMWFPAVHIDGHDYIDAVFATDANLDEAIHRGADELWIIWTVSQRGRWRSGFVAEYFQIIEASANSALRDPLRRVADNNAAVARGEPGAFGRHIEVKMLQAEVPIHYLFNFTQRRMARGVDQGVSVARRW